MNGEETRLYTPQYGAEPEKAEATVRFEVEAAYTFQDLLALNRLVGKTTRRGVTLATRILCSVWGVVLLASSCLLAWWNGIEAFNLASLFISLLLLALGVFHHYLNAWQSKRMMMKFDGLARFEFGAEEFTERTSLGKTSHPYKTVYAAYHYKDRFFIMMDKKHSYILPESGFIHGLPAEFGPFMKEKCGKNPIVIR